MKTLIALFLMSLASVTFANDGLCTFVIKDRYGYEYENHTRLSCGEADYACRSALSAGQAAGRYYDAFCEQKFGGNYPNPGPIPPRVVKCTTDLVDNRGYVAASFSRNGLSEFEACSRSNQQCQAELGRYPYGFRCLTRGTTGYPNPQPPMQTAQCRASRFDPAGYYISSYIQNFTGPAGTDVRGEACRRAFNLCSNDIRGRQTCRIDG